MPRLFSCTARFAPDVATPRTPTGLYYTGSVVTDITANVTDSQGTFGVTNTVGINAGETLYINHEAVQVFSIDPGTSSIGVFRAQEGTTAVAHSSGAYLQRDDGLGWFMANTHTDQDALEELEDDPAGRADKQ